MQLDGPLNLQALQASIDDLVSRHETLRTLFSVTMGQTATVRAGNHLDTGRKCRRDR